MMKRSTKLLALLLTAVILVGSFSCVFGSAESVIKKTMMQYTSLNLTFSKPESAVYACALTGNGSQYITVDANNEGSYYWLMVRSKKATSGSNKPMITVTETVNGEKVIVKKFQITVTAAKKIAMSDVKINKGTSKNITLTNPYEYEYKFDYNKKIIAIKHYLTEGGKVKYTFKGLKNGKTTVKAYLKGTTKLIGSFSVSVGDYKAGIKKDYQSITLYYNSHIDSKYLEKGTMNLAKAIGNFHADGVYTVKLENTKLAGTKTVGKTSLTPKAVSLFSKKTGKTKIAVYEQRGKKAKKKIGTITLTVKKAKDSAVFSSNRGYDNDGIFYELELAPGQSFDLKKAVVNRYINSKLTGSKFKASEYSFTAKTYAPELIAVDSSGMCTCVGLDPCGSAKVEYTVTFQDGSKVSCSGLIGIVEQEEE